MKTYRLFFFVLWCAVHFSSFGQATLIPNQNTVIDTFFETYIIEDNYRWLENTESFQTKWWVNEQIEITEEKLSKYRKKSNAIFAIEKYARTRYDLPTKKGDYFFNLYYTGDYNAAQLFYRRSLHHDLELLFDPNIGRKKDILDIEGFTISNDSKYLAILLSRNGTDWREIKVVNLPKRVVTDEHLTGLKFSNVLWLDDGFYYTTYEQEGKFGKTHTPRVYYHTLGQPQAMDSLIIERPLTPHVSFSYQLTSDHRFLIMEIQDDLDDVTSFYYIDYNTSIRQFRPLIHKLEYSLSIIDSYQDKLIAFTRHNAPNGLIITIDPAKPKEWKEFIPEMGDAVIRQIKTFEKELVIEYFTNGNSLMAIFDYNGELQNVIKFPLATSMGAISGDYSDRNFYFYFKSFTIPPIVYTFDLDKREYKLTDNTVVHFAFDDIIYKQFEFPIDDTLTATLTIVHDADLKMNGQNPTIVKAYGGYGTIYTPSFDPGIVWFIKNGGIVAIASIRGGGEKGIDWWEKAHDDKKQTTINDLIKAAEFMVEQKYTQPGQIGLTGGSHGGLVVASAGIQRPDLFGAIVPKAGPMDMLRFELFTVGKANTPEFGSVTDSLTFVKLLDYSPYHTIKSDVNYPPMLLVTGENDDRVPPFHSYKFVAKLQANSAQTNPILLKAIPKTGHYGQIGWKNRIRNVADEYSFFMFHLTRDK